MEGRRRRRKNKEGKKRKKEKSKKMELVIAQDAVSSEMPLGAELPVICHPLCVFHFVGIPPQYSSQDTPQHFLPSEEPCSQMCSLIFAHLGRDFNWADLDFLASPDSREWAGDSSGIPLGVGLGLHHHLQARAGTLQ